MNPRVHYTVVGIFVVTLAIVGLVIFYWLSVKKHDIAYDTYVVYVHEDVTGLSIESPVRYNGVRVGFVDQITLDTTNPQLVRLLLKIRQGTPITTATVATLNTQGITGVVYVGLSTTRINAPLLTEKPGEKYPVIPAKPSLLVQLSKVLPEITEKIQLVSDRVASLLDDKNRQAIAQTLQNIAQVSNTLSENTHQIDESIKNLNVTMKNAATASQKFPDVMNDMQTTMKSITQVSKKADIALTSGDTAINNFSNQLLPSMQHVLYKLNRLISHLENFSQELSRNPAVLIRGKTPEPLGPGEQKQ